MVKQDNLVHQDRKVLLELLVGLEPVDSQVLLDQMDRLDKQAQLGQLDLKEILGQMEQVVQ